MPKYRFTTGRYAPSGERIRGKTERATKGKLSTLSGLKYGGQKPVKKSEQVARYEPGKGGRQRKVLAFKGSAKTYAQMTLGKYIKQGKVKDVQVSAAKALNMKKSVLALAREFRAPQYMIHKIERMDDSRLLILMKMSSNTMEVVFDYGEDDMADVDDYDLFYNPKWDDIQFLIDQYERAWGVID